MNGIHDEDRRRRLRMLEDKIQDRRGIANIDSLLDTVQALYADCDHPSVKKMKNIEMYINRCKYGFVQNFYIIFPCHTHFNT